MALNAVRFRTSGALRAEIDRRSRFPPARVSAGLCTNMISTRQLTPKGDRAIRDLAQHYGVSVEAVRTVLFAVSAGGGTLAQFDHPELGGSGRWMSGGMTMVGELTICYI